MKGNNKADRRKIIHHLAKDNGMSGREIEQWLAEKEIILHRAGGGTVQNVPEQIYNLCHSGAALALDLGEKSQHSRPQ